MAEETPVKSACKHCGKPVYAAQGYNGATLNHWDCEAPLRHVLTDTSYLTALKDMDPELKRKFLEGDWDI